MKKTIIIILSLVVALLTGCSQDEREIVRMEADRQIYLSVDELEAAADIIVVGEFVGEDTQKAKYQYETEKVHKFLTDIYSTNEIEIKKVLKGKVDSETIKVSQSYGIEEDTGRLITFSEMTPMKKGENWIFFLKYNESNDSYWCAGDYSGRYPLPNDDLLELCNKVKEIKRPLLEVLTNEKEVSHSQADKIIEYNEEQQKAGKRESSDFLYEASDGRVYQISESKDKEIIADVYSKIDECRAELDPSVFGVYDTKVINLELYCDILDRYVLITDYDKMDTLEDVQLSIEEGTLSSTGATFILYNGSDYDIRLYPEPEKTAFHVFKDSEWVNVKDETYNMTLRVLKISPSTEWKIEAPWGNRLGELPEGKYRYVRCFTSRGKEYCVTCEFEL